MPIASDPAVQQSLRPEPTVGRPRTPAREPSGAFDALVDSGPTPAPRPERATRPRRTTQASDRCATARGTDDRPGPRSESKPDAPERQSSAAENNPTKPDTPRQAKDGQASGASAPAEDAKPNPEITAIEAEQFAALSGAVTFKIESKSEVTPVPAKDTAPARPEKTPEAGEAAELVATPDPPAAHPVTPVVPAVVVPAAAPASPAAEPAIEIAAIAPATLQAAPEVPVDRARPAPQAQPAAAPAADAGNPGDTRDAAPARPSKSDAAPAAPNPKAAPTDEAQPAPVLKTTTPAEAPETKPAEKADTIKEQPHGRIAPVAAQHAPAGAARAPGPEAPVAPQREAPVHQPHGQSGERRIATRPTSETPADATAPAAQPANSLPSSNTVTDNAPIVPLTVAAHAALPTLSALTALRVDTAAGSVPVAGLAVEIAARAQDGLKRFEIRLDPPELGRIDVRLDVDHSGKVTSRLVVDRAETLDLLRRDAPQLERALQHAGLNTEGGLQFSLRDQSFANRDQGMRDGANVSNIIVPDDELAAAEAARRGYGRLIGLGGGVDIRV